MPAMVGTASMDWMLRTVGLGVDAIEPALAASPPGANGVEVLPYFATSGERAPFVDPHASGQVTGYASPRPATIWSARCARAWRTPRGTASRWPATPAAWSRAAAAPGRAAGCRSSPTCSARRSSWRALPRSAPAVPCWPPCGSRGDEVDAATWTAPQAEVEPDPDARPATTTATGATSSTSGWHGRSGPPALARRLRSRRCGPTRGDRLPVSAGDPAAARTAVVSVCRQLVGGAWSSARPATCRYAPATCWPSRRAGSTTTGWRPTTSDARPHREAGRRPLRPTSELALHLVAHASAAAGGDGCTVVHTHAVASTALSTVADGPWAPRTTTARCSEDRCR